MPLIIKEKVGKELTTLIWHRTEPDSFFLSQVDVRQGKWNEVLKWTKRRRDEWLAGRFLIEHFLGCSSRSLHIDPNGKPQIIDQDIELSLSHSNNLIGLTYGRVPVGLDIQFHRSSIDKIAHKFCNPEELDLFSQHLFISEKNHFIWSCKEAVYKAYGRKKLDFRLHIKIRKGDFYNRKYRLTAKVEKDHISLTYQVTAYQIDDLYIASAIEIA